MNAVPRPPKKRADLTATTRDLDRKAERAVLNESREQAREPLSWTLAEVMADAGLNVDDDPSLL